MLAQPGYRERGGVLMPYSFYGHSDDCAEVDGDIREEIGCYDGEVRWRVGDAGGGVFVTASYGRGDGSVWAFTVEQIDEDIAVPWPISIKPEHGYSLRVNVDCPAGTPLAYATRKSGADVWGEDVQLPENG